MSYKRYHITIILLKIFIKFVITSCVPSNVHNAHQIYQLHNFNHNDRHNQNYVNYYKFFFQIRPTPNFSNLLYLTAILFSNEHLQKIQNQQLTENTSNNKVQNNQLLLNQNAQLNQELGIFYYHTFINYFNYLHESQLAQTFNNLLSHNILYLNSHYL